MRGEADVHEAQVERNGFVHAADIQPISRDGCHAFRLVCVEGGWRLFASYFGGRVGATATFPGPNHEDWNTLDVVVPIKSREWAVSRSADALPLDVTVEWLDAAKITPSFKLQRSTAWEFTEMRPARRPR